MALKKSELYSSLWSSCDELRGGMDASQYKDYGDQQKNIAKLTLRVPDSEQTAIATVLSNMTAGIAAFEANLAKTRSIEQGMMHEPLTGRIRLV
jgi:hypothetical protein